jgi:hypothetical protein
VAGAGPAVVGCAWGKGNERRGGPSGVGYCWASCRRKAGREEVGWLRFELGKVLKILKLTLFSWFDSNLNEMYSNLNHKHSINTKENAVSMKIQQTNIYIT